METAIYGVPAFADDVAVDRGELAVQYTSDEGLLLRFQERGEMRAFEELFRRHKDAFVSFLWRLSGRRTVAEEVSQHCWLKLIELAREGRYRPVAGATFRTYLYTLGRNRYIDAYCRSQAEASSEALDEATLEERDADDDPVDTIARDERAARVAQALAALPAEQREVISLWMAGFSIEDMARLTGAPRDTVLSRKRYALARLKPLLAAEAV